MRAKKKKENYICTRFFFFETNTHTQGERKGFYAQDLIIIIRLI